MKLAKGRREILEAMWQARDTRQGELTQAVPGGWWLGNKRVSGAIGQWLLRNSLIRGTYSDVSRGVVGAYTIYVAAPEVGQLLENPTCIPEGVALFRRFAQQNQAR